ncbi:hypothetical protein [Methylotuvimicrobium buryatense]|nr:hypothetical protein [Methylotuvimicrobium buryatense]
MQILQEQKSAPAADILAKHTPHPFWSPNWELLPSTKPTIFQYEKE